LLTIENFFFKLLDVMNVKGKKKPGSQRYGHQQACYSQQAAFLLHDASRDAAM